MHARLAMSSHFVLHLTSFEDRWTRGVRPGLAAGRGGPAQHGVLGGGGGGCSRSEKYAESSLVIWGGFRSHLAKAKHPP